MLSTASVRPIPAADVFAPNAMPLHLPQLEVYLSDRDLFAEPLFSDAQVLATETERLLYGYDDATAATAREGGDQDGRKYKPRENGSKSGSGKMEAAGGQFVIPRAAIRLHFKGSSHGKQDQDKRGVAQSGDKLSTEAEEDTEEEEEAGLLDVQTGPPSAPQTETTGTSVPTISAGVPSSLSTASHPVTRLEMFPPMMLLKDMGGLRELKSNAVGPRAPPGGLLSSVPGLGSLLGTVIDFMIGMEGSSFAANLISLELVRDFAQLMANQLQFSSSPYVTQTSSTMARFIFLRLPQIIALDFVSVFGKAAIFFIIWIVFTTLALWRFYRMTSVSDPNREVEGYDSQPYIFSSPKRGTKVANIFIVFVLTGLYIPLTKLSVDALTWSSAWWVVANPYTADVDNPSLPPLGDAHLYRDPLDFCWTTTMRKDEFNFAWIILPFAILSILFYTLWFPYRMLVTIKAMLPRVAEYNELGHKRSEAAMQEKYYLLLSRDKSPLNFMYNAYRRRWGFYKPLYILCFKLVNTFIIAFFTKSNCVWRSFAAKTMLVSQQIVLLVVMSILCVIHFFLQPFVDAISNRSEMVSRFGYVATAIIGLLVALQVDGSTVYNTTILYIVEGVMYTLTIYFSLAGTSWFAHWVKRTQRRFDFSIDIFSPLLNIDKHIKRRIWQETLSTILLCGPGYQMPQDQVIAFSTSDTDKWPPYLLWFEGTVAERHVENLKILKAIGLRDYRRAVQYRRSHVAERLRNVTRTIQTEFAGPDAYWHPIRPPYPDGVSSWFGKAFLVPFPPTLVIRYDQGSSETIQLDTLEEMERFIEQNSSEPVQSKRMVRRVLRALEGQTVFCPYNDMAYFGADVRPALLNRRKNRYTLARPTAYNEGILRISHRQRSDFAGYNFSSGFRVTITYYEGQRQDPAGLTRVRKQVEVHASSAFGLHDDFEMTPHLIQFFRDNEHIIRSRLPVIDDVLANYRRHFYCEAREKERVLSYAFLTDIFDNVQLTPAELMLALRRSGCCRDVRRLSSEYQAAVTVLYERMCAVNRSLVHRWWWLFWDDLWRKNAGDYQRLRAHRRVLSPHYPTSIAYRPMPRLQLEKFLKSRGLWSGAGGGKASLFTRGLLNRIYFQLDQLVFAGPNADGTGGSAAAIPVGLGHTPDDVQRIAYSTIKQHDLNLARGSVPDLPAAGRVAHHAGDADGEYGDPSTTLLSLRGRAGVGSALSSQLTGGGTSYDQQSIITRPAFAWERRMLFLTPSLSRLERVRNRLLEWLSLHPFIVDPAARALFLYLSIEEGRYTLPSVHWKQPAVEGAFSVAAAAEPTAATVKVMMPAPPTTTTLDAHTVTIHANVFSMPPSRARMIAGSPGAAAEEDVRDDGEAVQLTRLSAR
ncbi:hypothetical protein K437DRAFT_221651 [Tilletiaria anomala UBC 951]|uniref:Uncharacterized protein n=1 Tax=Tilletiaria anomala (strain ATCC 24038 / CBS 436.72 / UBC 951) TaxID=1037660 RepID=A0A066WL14_TILAU|nr:uncharacterized protein K437DRAFT_221651 [Tilletiaria anomala UBC 951]KDN51310.1 hypothetical protein K437DRAFT_221651 [Tilletiaria anomala UBC 951]